jgi:uncharacterized protein (DUF488 family)
MDPALETAMNSDTAPLVTVYTVGHSDHTTDALLLLLQQHGIALVVDVRSQPYSQWVPQFNRENLARDLQAAGIRYVFLGDSLGGRPKDRKLYDPDQEHPNYERLASSPEYLAGIEQLLQLAAKERAAILCSEGDHHRCHRGLLITPTLLAREARVLHIAPDGTLADPQAEPKQLTLF